MTTIRRDATIASSFVHADDSAACGSSLRIALVAPYDLARAGGIATHIRAQARALGRLGHDVRVLGPASMPGVDGELSLGGCLTVTFGGTESGLGIDPRGAARLRALFRTERFDIVHVHEPLVPVVPWSAVWFAASPLVGTFHVHREDGHRLYPIARRLLARLVAKLDARIAVSEPARRTVAAHFPGEYEIVPNGIDSVRFARRSAPPEGLPDASPTVLYVGRLEPRKGVGVLIHAMEAVRRRLPNAALVIVGDGPERRALEELAAAQATPIRFVGRVNNDELPPYFHASDVVCSPALGGESFGIVLLEALAAGKPVVASRIEGYATVVSDGPCVRLVTPGDADDLAAGIVDLVARAISPEDAAAVARPYDWALIAERLVSVYRRVQRTFIARPR